MSNGRGRGKKSSSTGRSGSSAAPRRTSIARRAEFRGSGAVVFEQHVEVAGVGRRGRVSERQPSVVLAQRLCRLEHGFPQLVPGERAVFEEGTVRARDALGDDLTSPLPDRAVTTAPRTRVSAVPNTPAVYGVAADVPLNGQWPIVPVPHADCRMTDDDVALVYNPDFGASGSGSWNQPSGHLACFSGATTARGMSSSSRRPIIPP